MSRGTSKLSGKDQARSWIREWEDHDERVSQVFVQCARLWRLFAPHRLGNVKRIVFMALAAFAFSLEVAIAELDLTLVHVNDWDQMAGIGGKGGAARIASVVAEERDRVETEGGLLIVTFGGDMISPSVLSGIDKGAHMIDLANAIGFDVAVLGNHEFDFGPEVLQERLEESDTVWLASNVSFAGATFPSTESTLMVEREGYRIGFLGLVTTETSVISSPGPDVAFRSVVKAGMEQAAELKAQGADIIVALTHQGLGADLELLREVEAIDLVLGGHDHLLLAQYDGRDAVMKAGSQGFHVGVLRLSVNRIAGRGGTPRVVWTPEFRLRSTAEVEGDVELATKVKAYKAGLDTNLDIVIGKTAVEISTRGFVRGSAETAFGNLVTDAMRRATGADVALTNSGGIRGDTIYPPGTDLTRKMVLTELPFGDRTVLLELSGAQLREALENGVSRAENPSGRFLQVSGISFTYDLHLPPGDRVKNVDVGGQPLEDDRTYRVATNDFLANGGDGYAVFKAGTVLIDGISASLTTGQVIDYIIGKGSVSPRVEGRITRLD